MASVLFQNQNPDIPFRNEVAFEYNQKLFKVHVHKVVEGSETIYKLFFKNNIENTNKSIMKLLRNINPDGTVSWVCKADYFSVIDNDMAVIAGAAIEKVLTKSEKEA
ncbi:MAG: hypothetical protein JWQ40_2156 [Segetibacter sp.]|nr:hypothetical protein [Segetibacter sp.]